MLNWWLFTLFLGTPTTLLEPATICLLMAVHLGSLLQTKTSK